MMIFVVLLMSCATSERTENVPTVSVTASATVTVSPDTASFSISSEAIKPTTEEARNATSKMINDAIEHLKDEFGITDSELKTSYMNISPYYEWRDNERVLVGQRANQSVTVTLKNDLDKAGRVYDRLSVLDGISISSMSYSKSDTSAELNEAREKASKAALEKATAYAKGLGKEIGDAITVSDGTSLGVTTRSSNGPLLMMKADALMAAPEESYVSTTYYSGDLTVSAQVAVLFTLK